MFLKKKLYIYIKIFMYVEPQAVRWLGAPPGERSDAPWLGYVLWGPAVRWLGEPPGERSDAPWPLARLCACSVMWLCAPCCGFRPACDPSI